MIYKNNKKPPEKNLWTMEGFPGIAQRKVKKKTKNNPVE